MAAARLGRPYRPYRAAVRPLGGVEVRLAGATAIELRPLEAAVVARYLRDSAGGPAGGARWDPVLATFTVSDPPPVAQALAAFPEDIDIPLEVFVLVWLGCRVEAAKGTPCSPSRYGPSAAD